jgi:hypothetical protein
MRIAFVFAAAVCVTTALLAQARVNPTDPQPGCNMCPGTYIPLSELDAYTKKAMAEKLVDQQMRTSTSAKPMSASDGVSHQAR